MYIPNCKTTVPCSAVKRCETLTSLKLLSGSKLVFRDENGNKTTIQLPESGIEILVNNTPIESPGTLNLIAGDGLLIVDEGDGAVSFSLSGDPGEGGCDGIGVEGVTGELPIVVNNTDPLNPIVTLDLTNLEVYETNEDALEDLSIGALYRTADGTLRVVFEEP